MRLELSGPLSRKRLAFCIQALSPAPTPAPPAATAPVTVAAAVTLQELKLLRELHEVGTLTDEEYQDAKASLLAHLRAQTGVDTEGRDQSGSPEGGWG